MARPYKNIDWELFEQLCAIQCTQSEIASMLKIDRDTLRDRAVERYGEDYSAINKKYSESGKCSLRRNQFVLSKKNASMAIWLGKIWLGQQDPAGVEALGITIETLKSTVREIQRERRVEPTERSSLENQQPVLDQECRGVQAEV